MQVIHITEASHRLLDDWLQCNRDYALSLQEERFFKKMVISFDADEDTLTCYCERKKSGTKISVKQYGMQLAKLKIISTPDGENDYGITFTVTDEIETQEEYDYICDLVSFVASDYIAVNALFFFGNIVEAKTAKLVGRSTDSDKHYHIKQLGDKIYAVNTGSHRSPEGVFPVRGHFRKYRDGKIIWIDQYMKGQAKEDAES